MKYICKICGKEGDGKRCVECGSEEFRILSLIGLKLIEEKSRITVLLGKSKRIFGGAVVNRLLGIKDIGDGEFEVQIDENVNSIVLIRGLNGKNKIKINGISLSPGEKIEVKDGDTLEVSDFQFHLEYNWYEK